jgi:hypothetical protein
MTRPVRRVSGSVRIVFGAVDRLSPSVRAAREDVRAAIADGVTCVTIDLAEVYAIEEGAVALLSATATAITMRQRRMYLALPSGEVVDITDPVVVRKALHAA